MPIGVIDSLWDIHTHNLEHLKKLAVFFDEIRMPGSSFTTAQFFDHYGEPYPGGEELLRQVDYLFERGFLRYSGEFSRLLSSTSRYELKKKELRYTTRFEDERWQGIFSDLKHMTGNSSRGTLNSGYAEAFLLRRYRQTDAISLALYWQLPTSNARRNVDHRDLYEILITGLPLPDGSVPWEDIFEFRFEAASQQQLRALRLWITDMAKGKLTYSEAVDKIEYLKEEYRAHMKGAGIRARNSALRTLIVGAADILESAIKLKLKDLADAPFKLLDAKADLMEADRNAVGRELAYVVRAEERFG